MGNNTLRSEYFYFFDVHLIKGTKATEESSGF